MRAAVLLFALPGTAASATPKVDVVVLRNGSRIVGEIRSMTKSRLELKTDDMGTLQIEWDNISELTAPEFFEVEQMNGGLYFGALRPGPASDMLEMTRDLKPDAVKAADAFLVRAGAVSLTEMRAHIWRIVPKVLALSPSVVP